MDNTFTEIKKNFGFGCMRLPMVDGEVDMEQFKQMVDLFLEEGFNYFDTAHGYLDGKSEPRGSDQSLSKGQIPACQQADKYVFSQGRGNPPVL